MYIYRKFTKAYEYVKQLKDARVSLGNRLMSHNVMLCFGKNVIIRHRNNEK